MFPVFVAVFFRQKTKTMEFVREERMVWIFLSRNSYERGELLYSYKKFVKVKNNLKESAMFTSSDITFLVAAFASFVASVSLWFLVDNGYGMFVGLWVPSILALWVGVRHCSATAEMQQSSR